MAIIMEMHFSFDNVRKSMKKIFEFLNFEIQYIIITVKIVGAQRERIILSIPNIQIKFSQLSKR